MVIGFVLILIFQHMKLLQTQTQKDNDTNKYSESLWSLLMFVEELDWENDWEIDCFWEINAFVVQTLAFSLQWPLLFIEHE
jgi:hypothetical protein